MPEFLKGNYEIPESEGRKEGRKRTGKSQGQALTDKLEEEALSKLGGSMSFVMKGKTFVWKGE